MATKTLAITNAGQINVRKRVSHHGSEDLNVFFLHEVMGCAGNCPVEPQRCHLSAESWLAAHIGEENQHKVDHNLANPGGRHAIAPADIAIHQIHHNQCQPDYCHNGRVGGNL